MGETNPLKRLIEWRVSAALEPMVREVLTDWHIYSLWCTVGYCIVGRPKS